MILSLRRPETPTSGICQASFTKRNSTSVMASTWAWWWSILVWCCAPTGLMPVILVAICVDSAANIIDLEMLCVVIPLQPFRAIFNTNGSMKQWRDGRMTLQSYGKQRPSTTQCGESGTLISQTLSPTTCPYCKNLSLICILMGTSTSFPTPTTTTPKCPRTTPMYPHSGCTTSWTVTSVIRIWRAFSVVPLSRLAKSNSRKVKRSTK